MIAKFLLIIVRIYVGHLQLLICTCLQMVVWPGCAGAFSSKMENLSGKQLGDPSVWLLLEDIQ